MLKVEDVHGITDYCRVLGHSAREAARVFQRSRNTIAKALKEGIEGFRHREVQRREPRVLLAEHQRYIDDVLEGREGGVQWGKQKHNGLSIANHLREHLGYEGSVSQVRRYLHRRRGELGVVRGEVSLDRVKEPTGLCEADWTEVKIYLAGVLTSVWLFVMRFRFSGALYVRGYRAMDTESLLDGLQRGFEWFGGVLPRELYGRGIVVQFVQPHGEPSAHGHDHLGQQRGPIGEEQLIERAAQGVIAQPHGLGRLQAKQTRSEALDQRLVPIDRFALDQDGAQQHAQGLAVGQPTAAGGGRHVAIQQRG